MSEVMPEVPGRMAEALEQALLVDLDERVSSVDTMIRTWTEGAPIQSPDIDLGEDSAWGEGVLSLFSEPPSEVPWEETGDTAPGAGGNLTYSGSMMDSTSMGDEPVGDATAPGVVPSRSWPRIGLVSLLLVLLIGAGVWWTGRGEVARGQEESEALFVFQVEDERAMERFADAREAFYAAQFFLSARLVEGVIEDHPDEPAPILLKAVLEIFTGAAVGNFLTLLDQARVLGGGSHPSALHADLFFGVSHSTDRQEESLVGYEAWLQRYPNDFASLVITHLAIEFEVRTMPERFEDQLGTEVLRERLLEVGEKHPLSYVIVASSMLNEDSTGEDFEDIIDGGIAVAQNPSYLLYLRGEGQVVDGDLELAKETYTKVLQMDPSQSSARVALVDVLLKLNEEQERQGQVAIILSPTTSDASKMAFYLLHGLHLGIYGRLEEAIDLLQRRVELSLETGEYLDAANTVHLARTYAVRAGHREKFESLSRQLLELMAEPNMPAESRQGLVTVNLTVGILAKADAGDDEGAASMLARLEATPESSFMFWPREMCLSMMEPRLLWAREDWTGLLAWYQENQSDCDVLRELVIVAEAFAQTEGVASAIEVLSRPLPEECDALPWYPMALSKLASLQAEAGLFEDARETIARYDLLWPGPDSDLPAVIEVDRVRALIGP